MGQHALTHEPSTHCLLWYGLERFFLPKSDVKSLDFVVTRFLMKLFRTVNHDVIRDCCMYLEFTLPSDYLVKKYENFILRYKIAVICIGTLAYLP